MDYLIPSSTEMPPVEVHIYENDPSPHNPLAVKGAGEGGTAGIGAAIANAVSDALREFEIEVTSLPLTPDRLLKLINNSRRNVVASISQLT
jgi:CO/xanthine dehydrogenase Mo-binding subunit